MVTPRIPLTAWQSTLPVELPWHTRRSIALGDGGCWLWMRSKDRDGYGWASLKNKTYLAHRLVYVLLRGEPAPGLVLDHLCRVRNCVNPDHLEPVTNAENLRRSQLTPSGMERCARGHDLSDYYGQRRCLRCKRDYDREYDRTRRAAS